MIGLPPPPPAIVALPVASPPAITPDSPEAIIVAPTVDTAASLRVAAALTEASVRVDSSFRGAEIVLYGAVFNPSDRPTDVVVVVRGPDGPLRLVKKTRNLGIWLNSRPVLFEGAPGFYMTASTQPLSDIAGFGQLRRMGVGVDHLRINAPEESRTVTRYGVRDVVVSRLGEDYLDWRRAVVRLKEKAELYDTDPDGVTFVDKGLFRARIKLPASAPTGQYRAEVWLFQDGEPRSVANLNLSVDKVGFERSIYRFAQNQPWLYGLVCVLLAAATGYGASRLFRRY